MTDIDHLEIKNLLSELAPALLRLCCRGCCPAATVAIRHWEQTLAGLLPASILSAWALFTMFAECNRVHQKIIKPFFSNVAMQAIINCFSMQQCLLVWLFQLNWPVSAILLSRVSQISGAEAHLCITIVRRGWSTFRQSRPGAQAAQTTGRRRARGDPEGHALVLS